VYVADAREFAAHVIRLDALERRNLGRGKAIEQSHLGRTFTGGKAQGGNISHAFSSPATKLDSRRYQARLVHRSLAETFIARIKRCVGFSNHIFQRHNVPRRCNQMKLPTFRGDTSRLFVENAGGTRSN
jgi:hypothetical protein